MQCPFCNLRFNTQQRKPLVFKCGHSLCAKCQPEIKKCLSCHKDIQQQQATLNYSLFEFVQKDKKNIDKFIKVCFIGGSGVGKTSIIRMLTGQSFIVQLPATIGYDFTFQDRQINGYNVRFQLWDSAGQQRYKAISPIHYKNADIVILVYDVSLQPENNKIGYWLNEAEKNCEQKTEKLLIGNKIDLVQGKIYNPLETLIYQKLKKGRIQNIEVSCKSQLGSQQLWSKLDSIFLNQKNKLKSKALLNPQKNQLTINQKSLNVDSNLQSKKKAKSGCQC